MHIDYVLEAMMTSAHAAIISGLEGVMLLINLRSDKMRRQTSQDERHYIVSQLLLV
jgi:hypothetical protein